MTFLSECSPVTAALYFIAVILPPMLSNNPIMSICAIIGAVLFSHQKNGSGRASFILLFIILAIINPIFSHNGATVLFLVNDTPITLESIVYGVIAALGITAVLYWFSCASYVMTSDRLLYLFGLLSPKLSLVLSSAIRYIPLFGRRRQEIEDAGRAMGLYHDGNIIDVVRGKLHVFSVMVTWALEDGIHTADSMAARGYGVAKRTHYSPLRPRRSDIVFTLITSALALPALLAAVSGKAACICYPMIIPPTPSHFLIISYISYALLALMPTITEITGHIKWKYLMSKI